MCLWGLTNGVLAPSAVARVGLQQPGERLLAMLEERCVAKSFKGFQGMELAQMLNGE